ncbi:MAG: pyridoxal phosphate-dependent aminotransferase [Acidobacteriaceae bacterium]|nr:pyridoxal phosphate-dependent aminotransferase [Acidobacteriaceae bacterium]
MKLNPFLLDEWLAQKHTADPSIEFDLGSSTGPIWTLRELLELGGDVESLLDTKLFYAPSAGSDELREAVAQLEDTQPEYVLVTTGAAEALLILFHAAAQPGANIVLPHPGFPTNEAVAESLGLEIRPYSIRPKNGFDIDPHEIQRLVDANTKLVLVNSPHNPTGTVVSDATMEALHDFCVARGVQLVSDEVYHPIYHASTVRSAARLPGATIISDFSKALCLSGLRIGWMIERDAGRRDCYLNARRYFTVSSSIVGEKLATLAARHGEVIYKRAQRIAQTNLRLLDRFFSEHADVFQWIRPSGGMTAFPWLKTGIDARPFCRLAAKRGVLLAPGDCFGCPAHFRVGFAASGDRFPEAIDRLRAILDEVIPLQQHEATVATGCTNALYS